MVSKQTDYGAWFYADPPSASHITHDNYHTGFILDAICLYGRSAGSDEFENAYRRGIEFYERRLFEPDGAARFMSDRLYPIDIHGCAQGVITFSLQQRHHGDRRRDRHPGAGVDAGPHVGSQERMVLLPAAAGIPDSYPGAALVPGLDVVGAGQLPRELRRHLMRGFPGRELSLDPGRSRFERMYANLLGAPANGLRIRLRRVLPATEGSYQKILDAGCGSGRVQLRTRQAASGGARSPASNSNPTWSTGPTQIAKRAGLTNCHFEQGDVTKLDFEDEFDLVVSVDNFEHVEDDIAAMRTLLRALRPGGRLVAHVPGYERRWILFGRRVNFDVPGHVRPGYQADELVGKLREAGFQVTSHQYTYGAIETLHQQHLLPDHRGRPAPQAPVRRGVPAAARGLLPREVLPAAVGGRRPGRGAPASRSPRRRIPDGRLIMRVLIDILHPAHVHFFRNFYAEMEARGHELCITARDKDRSVELLRAFDLPYQQISQQKRGAGLAVEMAQRTPRLMSVMRSFRPDAMAGIMGPSIALAGRLRLRRCPRWCSTTPSSPCRPTGSCTRWPTACARQTPTRARFRAAT